MCINIYIIFLTTLEPTIVRPTIVRPTNYVKDNAYIKYTTYAEIITGNTQPDYH